MCSACANPFEAIGFLEAAYTGGLWPFDAMLELKSKDAGLLRLRQDLQRCAPELAAVWS